MAEHRTANMTIHSCTGLADGLVKYAVANLHIILGKMHVQIYQNTVFVRLKIVRIVTFFHKSQATVHNAPHKNTRKHIYFITATKLFK